ncbi:MAG: isoprenylcysteine carboxylmethyltransferase family protein [Pseudomonadota bacterium]
MNWIDVFTILAYLSLGAELLCIPVPSVASSYQLTFGQADHAGAAHPPVASSGTTLRRGMRFFGPAALNVAVFLLPLSSALFSVPASSWERWIGASPLLLTVIGCAAVVAGRSLTIWAALDMRRLQSHALGEGGLDQPLQTDGLFQRSRNPGLCGMYLFAGGLLILYPSALFAIGLAHYLWHMHHRVLIEEGVLRQQFAERYAAYCADTPRYL